MQRFSIFLTPSEPDFSCLESLIRELCAKYGYEPFEPHVTLCSGDLHDPDALIGVVSAAVRGMGPFTLDVRRVACREEYFRSLFIEFEEHPALQEMCRRVRRGLGMEAGHDLFLHLSLLYGDMPLDCKEALAKRIALDRSVIHFSRVKIVTPMNRAEGWRDTLHWRTLFHARLGKAGPGPG